VPNKGRGRKRKSRDSPGAKTVRLKGTSVERAIVYGNVAWWLGKEADELHTHRWVAYLRGPLNEDLSYFIKKVVFTLHPSFQNPIRVVDKPPFELAETGWGEFEISMKVFFVDTAEKPVDLFHGLALYPPEGHTAATTKKPVVRETADVLTFTDPTECFFNLLKSRENPSRAKPPIPHPACESIAAIQPSSLRPNIYQEEKEKEELMKLEQAREVVKQEILKIRNKYEQYDEQCQQLRGDVKILTAQAEEAFRAQQTS